MKTEQTVYPRNVAAAVESQLPTAILAAMDAYGWNAYGVDEIVKAEIEKAKQLPLIDVTPERLPHSPANLISDAVFSECKKYRYQLRRVWNESEPLLNVIGLNPSTADETVNDPTIRRCISFAQDWGYGGLIMTNIFGFRATDPKVMKAQEDPVGPDNNKWLLESAQLAMFRVCAWGTHGAHIDRGEVVKGLMEFFKIPVHCFGKTKDGHPKHPLYLPKSIQTIEY